jgi:hypothetical protein
VDAYVFVQGADRSEISGLKKLDDARLRFVTPLVGPYDAFVAIEANNLRDVEDAVFDRFRGAGLRRTDTAIAVRVPPPSERTSEDAVARPTALRRWFVQRQVEAYVRIRTKRGHAREVYDHIHEVEGYLGHALVAGTCDLIAGFGADDYQTVADQVLGHVQELDDVVSTVTSFAINDTGGSAF